MGQGEAGTGEEFVFVCNGEDWAVAVEGGEVFAYFVEVVCDDALKVLLSKISFSLYHIRKRYYDST